MIVRKYLILLLSILSLASCGSDNDDNGNGSNGGSSNAVNVNANTAENTTRLEFPHLASTGSVVLVHKVNGEINYSSEWDYTKKSSRWSCYELHKGNAFQAQGVTRYDSTNGYPEDPDLNADYYFSSDPFYGSGYDHGHICPSADRLNDSEMNKQTFYLTNMQPQLSIFNGSNTTNGTGVWLTMENAIRTLARKNNGNWCDTLYICKGGTIGTEGGTISASDQVMQVTNKGLIVPNYFFCALLMVKDGSYYSIALLFKHENNTDTHLKNYAISIDELEAKTGIDFFCNLPDKLEAGTEKTCIPSVWGFN